MTGLDLSLNAETFVTVYVCTVHKPSKNGLTFSMTIETSFKKLEDPVLQEVACFGEQCYPSFTLLLQ